MTTAYDFVWLNVFIPKKSDGSKNIFHGLNGLAQHRHRTGETRWFYAGDDSQIQEPVFIPRSRDAPEGDGWVMALVERHGTAQRCDIVVLDTRRFEDPVAVVQLPFHVKAQIHGNVSIAGERRHLACPVPSQIILPSPTFYPSSRFATCANTVFSGLVQRHSEATNLSLSLLQKLRSRDEERLRRSSDILNGGTMLDVANANVEF